MWTTALLFLALLQAPADYVVELENGASYHAHSATRDGQTWVLEVGGGTIRVRASEVKRVDRREETAESKQAPEPQVSEPQPVEKTEFSRRTFQVDGESHSALVPDTYDRAPGDEVVAFVHEDNLHSIRFASASVEESIWRLGSAIKRHHGEVYAGYRTRSERFTRLGDHQAWLLTFSYQKGDKTWVECQGFLTAGEHVLVVSVSVPDKEAARAESLVRSIGRSLQVDDDRKTKENR